MPDFALLLPTVQGFLGHRVTSLSGPFFFFFEILTLYFCVCFSVGFVHVRAMPTELEGSIGSSSWNYRWL